MLGKVRYNKRDVSGNCQESYVYVLFSKSESSKSSPVHDRVYYPIILQWLQASENVYIPQKFEAES